MKPKVNTDLFELQPNQTATISRSLVIIIADKDPVTCGDVIFQRPCSFGPPQQMTSVILLFVIFSHVSNIR